MSDAALGTPPAPPARAGARSRNLLLSRHTQRRRRVLELLGRAGLFLVTATSAFAVIFIFAYIIRDAWPFFASRGFVEFFTGSEWRPAADPPSFGALAIFIGHALVTLGAAVFAVPFGVLGAVCMSDMLPFAVRQYVKPVVEVLAAIPSVAFGFFALIVLAPLLQDEGGLILAVAWWGVAGPLALLATFALSDVLASRISLGGTRLARGVWWLVLAAPAGFAVYSIGMQLFGLHIATGTNALNASLILGIMSLPTVMSVSEDALQAVGRELREGAYALGTTRAEMLVRVVLPAASSGIAAAVILGVMRAVGETMVVWMASGNATQIPKPWYNYLDAVRTLTATIAGDMGEADHVTGSARYHVLWAMALILLAVSLVGNLISERIVQRSVARRS